MGGEFQVLMLSYGNTRGQLYRELRRNVATNTFVHYQTGLARDRAPYGVAGSDAVFTRVVQLRVTDLQSVEVAVRDEIVPI
jgi:hypothetical protein